MWYGPRPNNARTEDASLAPGGSYVPPALNEVPEQDRPDAAVDDTNTGVTDALRPSIPGWVAPTSGEHHTATANSDIPTSSAGPTHQSQPGLSSPSEHISVPSEARTSGTSQPLNPNPMTSVHNSSSKPRLDKHGMPVYTRQPGTNPILRDEYRYCTRDELLKPYRTHHCRICGTVSSSHAQ
jgi:hypothetical protein